MSWRFVPTKSSDSTVKCDEETAVKGQEEGTGSEFSQDRKWDLSFSQRNIFVLAMIYMGQQEDVLLGILLEPQQII